MKKMSPLGRAGLALALLSPGLFAQDPEAESTSTRVSSEFQAWNEAHGNGWHEYRDVETGYVQFLFGSNAEGAFEPLSDEDYMVLGRIAIESSQDLHGIESATLVEDRGLHLPLGLIGSTDKFTTRFAQEVNGVPVLDAYVNALFTIDGRLLSVQTTAMPQVAGLSTQAAIAADSAAKQALDSFEAETGLSGAQASEPELVIGQLRLDRGREAVLVWKVEVQWQGRSMQPEGRSIWIDASNGGSIYSRTNVHSFDVGGTVSTMATPGIRPDQANNPAVPFAMNHARVVGTGIGTRTTDENGNFNFAGVNGSVNLRFDFYGDWCNVNNAAGSDYQLNVSASGTGNNFLMNNSAAAAITSQASTFQVVSAQRDWIRSVNPSDSTGDFRATAFVNINDNCNATWSGNQINMFSAGGGCNATSFSTVVAHEMGHWYNSRYGTGNGDDGMGEGNADVFALYMYNTHLLGADFNGQGSGSLRNGNNVRMFCGDTSPGCHGGGGVHANGEVWMGAAWRIYLQLENSLGAAQADLVSDALFMAWMNGYNQQQIKSVIETQWLTLDDDNGNIDDGTPHFLEIDGGFLQKGFPGYKLNVIDFSNVTQLGVQNSEVGPYDVSADLTSLIGENIVSANIIYNVDNGPDLSVPMTPSGSFSWTGSIPGQASPALVRYYIQAMDSFGYTNAGPGDPPGLQDIDTLKFAVGAETQIFFDDFESGEGAWTHGTYGDSSNDQDDWQFGTPQGEGAYDPSFAASGSNCWGNDLGIGNFNGNYQDNVHNFLRSPVIDCSNSTGTVLRFNRWLTTEDGSFDRGRILVNGTQVWGSSLMGNVIDEEWKNQEVDISALADGNESVQIDFAMRTNGNTSLGGWTLDDVEVLSREQVSGACIPNVNYGFGKLSSIFSLPMISGVNPPSESANNFFIQIDFAVPEAFGLVFSGATAANVPLLGGNRLVGTPLQREGIFLTDSLGSAAIPQPVAANSAGTTRYFQAWFRDSQHLDGTGAGLTDGLEVRFCD